MAVVLYVKVFLGEEVRSLSCFFGKSYFPLFKIETRDSTVMEKVKGNLNLLSLVIAQ